MTRSRRAGLSRDEVRQQPLYARMLGLQYLAPSGFLCFVFLEGAIALGILLALAELVSWWGVLVLPVTVAAMVKLNDAVAGALTRPQVRTSVAGPRAGADFGAAEPGSRGGETVRLPETLLANIAATPPPRSAPAGRPAASGRPVTGGRPAVGGQPPLGGQPMLGGQPPLGGQPMLGGQPPLGGQPMLGGQPKLGGQPMLGGQPTASERPARAEAGPAGTFERMSADGPVTSPTAGNRWAPESPGRFSPASTDRFGPDNTDRFAPDGAGRFGPDSSGRFGPEGASGFVRDRVGPFRHDEAAPFAHDGAGSSGHDGADRFSHDGGDRWAVRDGEDQIPAGPPVGAGGYAADPATMGGAGGPLHASGSATDEPGMFQGPHTVQQWASQVDDQQQRARQSAARRYE